MIPRAIEALQARIDGFGAALAIETTGFETWPCMRPDAYVGKDVLDLGCGMGAASALFIDRGARSVWGVDPTLTPEWMDALRVLPSSRFTASPLALELFGEQRFDLVYSRVVTEHFADLPGALGMVYELLRPRGRFIGLHDNYYGPMGAHDHGMFAPLPDDPQHIASKAVRCWATTEKCEASRDFRIAYERDYDWRAREWVLTPEDCSLCAYYRRAQLWGHLLYRDEFPTVYAGEFFRSGAGGGLNKVTPFQLRQFLVEAGFAVKAWLPERVSNAPPTELLKELNESDLQTSVILFAAHKA